MLVEIRGKLMQGTRKTRVAVVHDWLTGMRGGEAVLEAILDIYPDADLFTLLHNRGTVSDSSRFQLARSTTRKAVFVSGR